MNSLTLVAFIPFWIGLITYGLAIRRILVSKSTSGTSATSLVVSAVSCVAWAVWSLWQGFGALALVNILWIPVLILPELAAMAVVRPMRWGSWWMIPAWAAVVLVSTLSSLAGGPDLLGVVVGASGLLWLAPALREIFRHTDLSGVSAASWTISGVSSISRGVYGLLDGAWAAIAYSAVQVLGIGAALARIAWLNFRGSGPRREPEQAGTPMTSG